ncbi:MAG: hypothetical protein COB62_00640 [Piscirickettsiaceae bacterium]|nr:MAG: hypothetical protein COB62_00640 [Piscirickettsiaceae bacterium]
MQITYSKIILLLTLFFSSVASYADDNDNVSWYSVEYIIFKNNAIDNQNLEAWTEETFLYPSSAISLTNTPMNGFRRLKPNQLQLHGVLNRLKRLSSYKPLAHNGWVQAIAKKSPLTPIRVSMSLENETLQGIITLHRRRFLHLDLDIQLSQQSPPVFTGHQLQNAPDIFRLKQTRRLKTGELHYFDHPQFGVIVKIQKIDPPLNNIMPSETQQSTSLNTEIRQH